MNAVSSKEGHLYVMGGLVNSSTVKGDLWVIGAGDSHLPCSPVVTKFEGPGPRVGHASLLVGNAFIVFGGDTKMDDRDQLDDTLYLLNTCKWSEKGSPAKSALTVGSVSPMVQVVASRTPSGWPVRPYLEYTGLENLCFWWTSRGLLFQ